MSLDGVVCPDETGKDENMNVGRIGWYVVTLLCGALLALHGSAEATSLSFTGTFAEDDDVKLFTFVVGAASTVTLRTYSYAGGTNAASTVIPRGGFDPVLTLFDGLGTLIGENDDGGASVGLDLVTGERLDSFLTIALSPGTYTVSITEADNVALGTTLGAGFSREGEGNFTAVFGCASGSFCDFTGDQRTHDFAFDVLNIESPANVPEPSPFALLGVGLGLVLLRYGQQRSRQAA